MPSEMNRAIISTYAACQSKVRVGSGEGEWFDTVSGVRQGAKTIKKNTNSTQNKPQTHRAKQYEVTSFLSTDCELSTETCSKNVYSLGPRKHSLPSTIHHVYRLRDQRSGHNPRRLQLHTGIIMLMILHKQQHPRENLL